MTARPTLDQMLARIAADPYKSEAIRHASGFPTIRLFPKAVVAMLRPVSYLMVVAEVGPSALREDWPFDHSAWGPDQRWRAFRNTLSFIQTSAYLDGWLRP